MKFELDFTIRVDDHEIDSKSFTAQLDKLREKLKVAGLEGAVLVKLDGRPVAADLFEPIFRFAGHWARKVPWILAGDTETLPFRNSEHCYAFVPAGESVEFSLFVGSETEVEEYVVEPATIRLDAFAEQILRLGERLLAIARAIDAGCVDSDEDCRDLATSLEEGRRAWKEHQAHNRR